eukprot:evm.model.scf_1119.5 EVM.evm.TU.scf_1119.5   scf_1119:15929-18275(+)
MEAQEKASNQWSGRALATVSVLFVVLAMLATPGLCQDGRIGTLGGFKVLKPLMDGYLGCMMYAMFNISPEPSTHLSGTLGMDLPNADARENHRLYATQPNIFQSDRFNGYAEFGGDKTMEIEATRYYCRCLDNMCQQSRVLFRYGGENQCLMAIDALKPEDALSCGDFLSAVDPLHVESNAAVPALPLAYVFEDDPKQQARFNDIPLDALTTGVNEDVRNLVRVLRAQERRPLHGFIKHEYVWRRLAAEDTMFAISMGLKGFQGTFSRTLMDELDESMELWVYRESRKQGNLIATGNGSIVFHDFRDGIPADVEEMLLRAMGKNLSFPGVQSTVDVDSTIMCNNGSDFVPGDKAILYKVVKEVGRDGNPMQCVDNGVSIEIFSGGLRGTNAIERSIDVAETTLPTVEAALSIAAHGAPTGSDLTSVALAFLAVLTSIIFDSMNAGTGFFIAKILTANELIRKGARRMFSRFGRAQDHPASHSMATPTVHQTERQKNVRNLIGELLLAFILIVLPDLVGLFAPFIPLALVIKNEEKVRSWSETATDANIKRMTQPVSDTVLVAITPTKVDMHQSSTIFWPVVIATAVMFVLTLAQHFRNMARWWKVISTVWCGPPRMRLTKGGDIRVQGWLEPWMYGVLYGNCDELKKSHEDVFARLDEKYLPCVPVAPPDESASAGASTSEESQA